MELTTTRHMAPCKCLTKPCTALPQLCKQEPYVPPFPEHETGQRVNVTAHVPVFPGKKIIPARYAGPTTCQLIDHGGAVRTLLSVTATNPHKCQKLAFVFNRRGTFVWRRRHCILYLGELFSHRRPQNGDPDRCFDLKS
jgi:hypothetical protein